MCFFYKIECYLYCLIACILKINSVIEIALHNYIYFFTLISKGFKIFHRMNILFVRHLVIFIVFFPFSRSLIRGTQ